MKSKDAGVDRKHYHLEKVGLGTNMYFCVCVRKHGRGAQGAKKSGHLWGAGGRRFWMGMRWEEDVSLCTFAIVDIF